MSLSPTNLASSPSGTPPTSKKDEREIVEYFGHRYYKENTPGREVGTIERICKGAATVVAHLAIAATFPVSLPLMRVAGYDVVGSARQRQNWKDDSGVTTAFSGRPPTTTYELVKETPQERTTRLGFDPHSRKSIIN